MFLRKFYMLGTNVVRNYQKQHKRLNEKILKYFKTKSRLSIVTGKVGRKFNMYFRTLTERVDTLVGAEYISISNS